MKNIVLSDETLNDLKDKVVYKNEEKEKLNILPSHITKDILGDTIRKITFGDKKIDDLTVKFEKEYGIWNLEYQIGFFWQKVVE